MAKKPMTKSQIVSHLAKEIDLPKEAASIILDELAALVVSGTQKTRSFTLPGLEILVQMKRKTRMGRNPATGPTIKIPPKTMAKRRVTKAAKEAIVPKRK